MLIPLRSRSIPLRRLGRLWERADGYIKWDTGDLSPFGVLSLAPLYTKDVPTIPSGGESHNLSYCSHPSVLLQVHIGNLLKERFSLGRKQ
jgi:hypothetical protein